MLRRSVLALIAIAAALPATRVLAEGAEPRKLTQDEIDLINAERDLAKKAAAGHA